jgi:hypothetical protein
VKVPRKSGRSQPVDATPSGMNSFSKVVIMRQGRRYGLSAAQSIDIWRLWKAGESLHEIGRAFGKDHGSVLVIEARGDSTSGSTALVANAHAGRRPHI